MSGDRQVWSKRGERGVRPAGEPQLRKRRSSGVGGGAVIAIVAVLVGIQVGSSTTTEAHETAAAEQVLVSC